MTTSLYNISLSRIIPLEITADLINRIKYGSVWQPGMTARETIILPSFDDDYKFELMLYEPIMIKIQHAIIKNFPSKPFIYSYATQLTLAEYLIKNSIDSNTFKQQAKEDPHCSYGIRAFKQQFFIDYDNPDFYTDLDVIRIVKQFLKKYPNKIIPIKIINLFPFESAILYGDEYVVYLKQ